MERDLTTITVQRTVKERFLRRCRENTVKSQSDMLERIMDENEELHRENQELRSQTGGD